MESTSAATAASEKIARPPVFLDRVARRKLKTSEDWEHFRWQRVGDSDDLLVTGGVPRLLKSGPRKGRKTWDGKGDVVVVTRSEIEADQRRYEVETGNCFECGGSGQEWTGWSAATGTRFMTCTRCAGIGKAPGSAA